jgi:carboxyl-terminal processing protease
MSNDTKNTRRSARWARRLVLAFAVTFILVAVLAAGAVGGIAVDRQVLLASQQPAALLPAPVPGSASTSGSASAEAGPPADFELLTEAYNSIEKNYVAHADVPSKDLIYGAISGMVEALNDTGHSRFLSPEMLKAENDATRGVYDGIGAEVASKGGHVVIVAPLDGSPAQKAGLHSGEIIMKVNGEDVSELPLEQVVGQILGPSGTQVSLTLFDPNTNQTVDVTLTRAHLTLQNVTWQFVPGTSVAHVRIAGFSQGVSKDLQVALTDIHKQGGTAIILDLRDNPGGLLDEAVNTASQFIASGNVLLERDAQGKITPVPVRKGGEATDIPMVVLINGGSASASEIVAAALQDDQRAKLVGETTFGTGTVLNQFPLSDGSALLLATQEWLTPNGGVIWHKGITPDVTVKLAAGVIPLRPSMEKTMTPEQVRTSGDQQLLQALDMLLPSVKQ